MADDQIKTVKMAELMDAVKHFITYLLRNIKWLLLTVVFTTVISIAFFFTQKPAYKGTVTFILEEKSSGMSGGLSGIASQFGFDIGGLSGNSGMFAGDNILDILKSRMIVEKVLLSKVDSSKGASSPTMIDLYLVFSGLKSKWENKSPELAGISYANLAADQPHSLVQDSILNVVYDKLIRKQVTAERLNKKGSIIKVVTSSGNQVFSKTCTERLLAETKKLYIDVKTSTSAANVRRLEMRADSLMVVLNDKSYKAASQQLVDANSAFKSAAVPAEVSQRDKMVNYTIYTEVVKNLELSRMALANQTPAIQLLDYSRFPLEDSRLPLFILVAIGIVAGCMIAFLVAFFRYPSASKTNE
jgi:uncharacterized protein involved in exopolysaccharide biosynthesis